MVAEKLNSDKGTILVSPSFVRSSILIFPLSILSKNLHNRVTPFRINSLSLRSAYWVRDVKSNDKKMFLS